MPSCFAWLRSRSGLLAAPPAAPRPPGSLRCPPSAPLQSATARRPKNLSPTGPFSLLPASAGQGLAVIPLRDISVGFFCLFRFCLVICFSGCVCGALGPCFFFRKNHIRFLAATRYSSRLMPCGGAHFRFLPVLFFFHRHGGHFLAGESSFAALAGVYLRFPCPGLAAPLLLFFHFIFSLFLSAALAVSEVSGP